MIRHVIQIAGGIWGFVVDRGRQNLVAQRKHADTRFQSAGPAELSWSDPVRKATDQRWCEDVSLTFTNSGSVYCPNFAIHASTPR